MCVRRLVAEREERLQEAELTLQRLGDEQVDKDALLDSMQSDKTALSRAMAQNRELKQQLAELQNGFVKMVSSCCHNFFFSLHTMCMNKST